MLREVLPLAISFDPEKRAGCSALAAAVGDIIAVLEAREAELSLRKRRRTPEGHGKFRLAVEAIVCNLIAAHLSTPGSGLVVPRDSNVLWAPKRYRVPVYGSHFLAALDLMTEPTVGLAVTVTKGFRLDRNHRQPTTIRATPRFLALLGGAPSWEDLKRDTASEVLVLRGPKDPRTGIASTIDYPETARTRRLRKDVQRLNRYLLAAPMIVLPASGPNATAVDPTRRTVRRIFNNGVWSEGGRFFDGFWETMPKMERFERLRIITEKVPEGERIANVDFGQLFPSLAYAMQDLSRPEADLYDVRGNGQHREGYKKLLNALLFATKPTSHWPTDTASEFPAGTQLRDVIAEISSHHKPIAHLFGTGIGFRLMHLESAILLDALFRLFAAGVTALPLHDSVLVAVSKQDDAKEAMQAAYREFNPASRAKLHSKIT